MEDTQKTNGEDSQGPKDTKILQQEDTDRLNKSMVFGSKKKEQKSVIYPNLYTDEINFRYRRFIGTAKHKIELFYNLKLLDKKESAIIKISNAERFIKNNQKKLAITGSIAVILFTGIWMYDANVGYNVTFNGKQLGTVRDKEIFIQAVDAVNKELSNKYHSEIVFEKDIQFEKTIIDRDKLLVDVEESAKAVFETNIELAVDGAVLVIEGKEVANMASVEDAQKVIDGVLEPFIKTSSKSKLLQEPIIKEEYSIVKREINFADVMEVDKAIELLSQGTNEIKEYKVKNGDTSWDIAVNRGVKIQDLEKANPDKDITDLHYGDIIKLAAHEPYLTIKTVKEEVIEEKVAYDTVYKNDSSLYLGKTKVVKEGQSGIRQIVSKVDYENGKEISEEVLKEKVVKEPIDKIVAKGTKALPPGRGTGQFRLPTTGRVSVINKPGSHSGGRAVDIANSIGTNIYAANSGTVIHASNSGNGYGKYIIISHGNGYTTLYAHLSDYKVSVGDRVARGQHIGEMGSTGNSTGSHLHFEILLNGVNQKITNYFAYLSRGRQVAP